MMVEASSTSTSMTCVKISTCKKCKSGAWNPEANSILERIHQVLGNCVRNFDLDEHDLDEDDP